MNIKKWAWMAGLLIATLAVTAVPGYSDTLSFEDDDVEAIIRCTNPATATGCENLTSGTITTGDIFFAVFEIPQYTVNGVDAIPAGSELTGVVALQVTGISVSGTYTFGAYSGFNALLDFYGSTAPDLAAGAAVAMFLNSEAGFNLEVNRSVNPATNCATINQCVQQATMGSLLQVDGFRGDPDEFWTATLQPGAGGGTIQEVLAAGSGTLVAAGNFGLSNFFDAGFIIGFHQLGTQLQAPCAAVTTYVADGCVQFSGSSTVTGGSGLTNGFIAHSDFDAIKYGAPIPEPSTVSLLGLGLLALGAIRMRSKKAK